MVTKRVRKATSGTDSCCSTRCCDSTCACRGADIFDCCRVEAVVSVDSRGQMVLPKEVRERVGFRPNEKLAIVSWMKGDQPCCLTLQRADDLAEVVRRTYGPLLAHAARGSQ